MKQSEKKDRMPFFRINFNILKEKYGFETNEEFARFLGMSRQTVGFYLNGDRIPDALILAHIANKCDVSADWLLGLVEVPTRDEDVKFICGYTGLTENSVQILHRLYIPDGFAPDEIILLIRMFDNLLSVENLDALKAALDRYIDCNVCWENRPAEYKTAVCDEGLEMDLSEEILQKGQVYDRPTPSWNEYVKQVSIPISARDAAMLYRNKAVEIVRQCAEKVFDDKAEYWAKHPPKNFRMYDTPRDENYVAPTVAITLNDKREGENGERKED